MKHALLIQVLENGGGRFVGPNLASSIHLVILGGASLGAPPQEEPA